MEADALEGDGTENEAELPASGPVRKAEAAQRTDAPRKRSWIAKYGAGSRDSTRTPPLPPPQEGLPLSSYEPAARVAAPAPSVGLPFKRSHSSQSITSPPTSRPTTPLRWSSASPVLTKEQLDQQANQLVLNALEPVLSASSAKPDSSRAGPSFAKKSLSSMMGGFSLSRGPSEDKERGRSAEQDKVVKASRAASFSGRQDLLAENARNRARSQSPFRLRATRTRDSSPDVQALSQSDVESDVEVSRIRPRNAFSVAGDDDDLGDDTDSEDGSEESWSDNDQFDPETEANTERNALIPPDAVDLDTTAEPDPLGEGVNLVIPPEPYFPSTLNTNQRNPRRRKSTRSHDTLPIETSRPTFERDRCTIVITQGDPAASLAQSGRRAKRYVLASDLSEESRYALEWGIGTVLRDGDEMIIVNVIESESKVDPLIQNLTDRTGKIRSQQERSTLAYILVRQATSLLQRTRLNVTISCQAWHAKNGRHMLLDIVDYVEPTMLIVGSRGLGNLKGILLGSTSHYLIQKCAVPVMVARRRLKRPPKRNAHLATHRARVSLAQAGIDRIAPKVDEDVAAMRGQIERDDERRQVGHVDVDEGEGEGEGEGEDPDTEADIDEPGVKVAG